MAEAAIRSVSAANRNQPPAQTSPALPRDKAKVINPFAPNFCAAFLTGSIRLMSGASFSGEKIRLRVASSPSRMAATSSEASATVAPAA
ncbi:hypothetical protein PANO111632_18960 [Paracoccus nototheniae]